MVITHITFEYNHVCVNVFIFQKSLEFNNFKINLYCCVMNAG